MMRDMYVLWIGIALTVSKGAWREFLALIDIQYSSVANAMFHCFPLCVRRPEIFTRN